MIPRPPTYQRILHAAKTLFATRGYEHAGTAAIARAASTSESQLMKHFGSKLGLLEAIFIDGWKRITAEAQIREASVTEPVGKIRAIAQTVFSAMNDDAELKVLMLFEARRVRREGSSIALTEGYYTLVALVDEVLESMRATGTLKPGIQPQAARSALIGMLEGMMRDRLLAERLGFPANFTSPDVAAMLDLFLNAIAEPAARGQAQ